MDTTRRLLLSVLVVVGGLALVAPARAADAVIAYDLANPDPSGIRVQVGAGMSACGAGCGALRLRPGGAIPAGRPGQLAFSAPAGTTIVRADLRLRWRTAQPGVSVRLQSQLGGRWVETRRLRAARAQTGVVAVGRGATAVAVALGADTAVPARRIGSDAENAVVVESVQLTVRDAVPPTVAWTRTPPEGGDWRRGGLCGDVAATDAGLGVDRVEYAVGGVVATASAGPGTRLQPRPSAFAGSVCVDSTQLADGTYGTTLTAVDAGGDGNRSTAVSGMVRVDNTPPAVAYRAPANPEARLPEAGLAVSDAASGVARVAATIDGIPAVLRSAAGTTTVVPAAPLADGLHRLAWEAVDAAGNAVSGEEVLGVLDATPPTIEDVQPQGLAGPLAVVSARASDTGAGVDPAGWRVAVDGVDMTGAAEIDATGTLRLLPVRAWGEGEHVVRVTAADRSGNRVVRTWTFALPVTPPPAPPAVAPAVPAADPPLPPPVVVEPTPEPAATATASAPRAGVVHLRARRTRVRVGGLVVLRGDVQGVATRGVRIEARAGGRWRPILTVTASAAGAFATPVRLPAAGAYEVRARAGSARSRPVRLVAR